MRWSARWLDKAGHLEADLWRGVEAQHVISTMRLADNSAEQGLLEQLLERSKPQLPPEARAQHFLLATPFRYLSPWPSRFRRAGDPGIWYGAESIETVCAEVGYWRWRFLTDSDGLRDTALLVEFTIFLAHVNGRAIDLTQLPWRRVAATWMNRPDYSESQRLAEQARLARVQWIRYASIRDAEHGLCGAVLDPSALSLPRSTVQQTWAARIQADLVYFTHDGQALQFEPALWH